MHKSFSVFSIIFILLLTNLFACNEDFENYSTNPQDLLAFSVDTLSFDTVLTTVNSPMKVFMVYNHHSKPLLISSVRLAEGVNSGFKINVDGFAGSSFENIEIGANDSLFVFVDVKPKANGQLASALLNDHVIFMTNTIEQKVVLEAYGQDVFSSKSLILTSDTVLSNEKPYLIYDSLVVEKGALVEVGEGSVFYMHNNAQVIVRGVLKIKGSIDKPVVFRGSRTDALIDIPYDRIPGQWGGIRFSADSYGNEFENVYLRNGRFGLDFEPAEPVQNKLAMKNVVLTNVSGILLNAVNCRIVAENCEFSNSRYAVLNLTGGSYQFTHCTIANFYPEARESGWLNSDNETLILTDTYYSEAEDNNPQYFPVINADFSNSIIWGGKLTSQIHIEENPKTSLTYSFRNCLIPNEGSNDDVFVDCIFHANPLFIDTDFIDKAKEKDEKDVFATFDFRLQERSPARNVANPEISRKIPYDLKGVDRFADGLPDLGAYEMN
jgi:hypothetical protein